MSSDRLSTNPLRSTSQIVASLSSLIERIFSRITLSQLVVTDHIYVPSRWLIIAATSRACSRKSSCFCATPFARRKPTSVNESTSSVTSTVTSIELSTRKNSG